MRACCRSSVVEHSIGNGEVDSSILSGSTSFPDRSHRLNGGVPVAFALSGDHTNGYTVGAGFEYLFTPNWSGKIEYQYYNLGDGGFTLTTALAPFGNFRTDDHVVKVGLNYRFNWSGPVIANTDLPLIR